VILFFRRKYRKQVADARCRMDNQFAELFSVTGHNIGAFWGWTVILAPPPVIRYAFFKRPVSKTMAVTISAVLWIVNVIAMAAMGREGQAHVVLVGIAIASYYVLRVGQRESVGK